MAIVLSQSNDRRPRRTSVRTELGAWFLTCAVVAAGGATAGGDVQHQLSPQDGTDRAPISTHSRPDGIVGRWCRPSNGSCTESDPQLLVEPGGQGFIGVLHGRQDRNGAFVSSEGARPYSLQVRQLTLAENGSTPTRVLYRGEVYCDRWPEVNGDKSKIDQWATIAIQFYSADDPVLPPGPRIDISWGCSWIQPPGMVPYR
jgi:hypothetical protein